jgi:multidrug efflux pump subunit AcrA (membrane-fusion protein)
LTALLELPGDALPGVVIPRAAVVRSEGRGWAFVQTGDDTFTRREVALTRPTSDGWFVAEGFKPGEKVVVTGAQVLLSEVGKAAIRMLE